VTEVDSSSSIPESTDLTGDGNITVSSTTTGEHSATETGSHTDGSFEVNTTNSNYTNETVTTDHSESTDN
jgi:hypothetical protein